MHQLFLQLYLTFLGLISAGALVMIPIALGNLIISLCTWEWLGWPEAGDFWIQHTVCFFVGILGILGLIGAYYLGAYLHAYRT